MLSRLNPLLLPGATSLRGYFRPLRNITLLAAMHGTGTSPPAVTLSGTLTQAANVVIDIDTGGARGTATFSATINGTSVASGVTAASVLLGSGLTANFATGTDYNADNQYRSVVSTLVGATGNTLDGESGSASVRPYVGTLNGRTALAFNGTTQRIRTTLDTLPVALIQGSDTAFSLAFVFQYLGSDLTPAENVPIIGMADGSAGDQGNWFFGVGSGGDWTSTKRGSTGASVNVTGGTADNDPHVCVVVHTGTAITVYIDGSAVISAAAQNADSITVGPDFFTLGGLSTPGTPPLDDRYAECLIGDVVAYTGAISTTVRTYVNQNLTNTWGL
jgi:hypothetical protein